MQLPFFIDFHNHPLLKPYGKSFERDIPGQNMMDGRDPVSFWYYDPPTLKDRLVQVTAGICKFRQSDGVALVRGNCRMIFASLYPIESGFFSNKLGQKLVGDLVNDFVTSVGRARVDNVQKVTNYFEDLQREYHYLEQMHGRDVEIGNQKYQYRIVRTYKEVEDYQAAHPDAENTVFIGTSIEGLHVLNSNRVGVPDEKSFLANLKQIKNWRFPPLFVTVAHHFYNQLCGHSKSLFDLVGQKVDQEEGMNTGFTDLGRKVVAAMLDITNGKPIYVDVKHMSALSRKQYLAMLQSPPFVNRAIPVIISHGAANGLRSSDEPVVDLPETGNKFMPNDINAYDNEIIAVAKTGGIFGLQLDEHRLANKETIKRVKHSLVLNKVQHYRAELVWNQVQHIAELLDRHNLPPWDCIVLGTDNDGIINPLNGFLTSEDLPDLMQYLERYAFNYINGRAKQVLKPQSIIEPSDIVNRIFSENGKVFLRKWFV